MRMEVKKVKDKWIVKQTAMILGMEQGNKMIQPFPLLRVASNHLVLLYTSV